MQIPQYANSAPGGLFSTFSLNSLMEARDKTGLLWLEHDRMGADLLRPRDGDDVNLVKRRDETRSSRSINSGWSELKIYGAQAQKSVEILEMFRQPLIEQHNAS